MRACAEAIAELGGVEKDMVPRGDVHELLEKYDTNLNGLDQDEFAAMMRDLIDSRTTFTDFESLDQLSTRQLHALKAHDWSARPRLQTHAHTLERTCAQRESLHAHVWVPL
jgi:hypothetical protein